MTPTVPPAKAAVISLTVGPMTTPLRLSKNAYPVPTVAGSITIRYGRRIHWDVVMFLLRCKVRKFGCEDTKASYSISW